MYYNFQVQRQQRINHTMRSLTINLRSITKIWDIQITIIMIDHLITIGITENIRQRSKFTDQKIRLKVVIINKTNQKIITND